MAVHASPGYMRVSHSISHTEMLSNQIVAGFRDVADRGFLGVKRKSRCMESRKILVGKDEYRG